LKPREIKSGNACPAEFMITVVGVGFIQPVFFAGSMNRAPTSYTQPAKRSRHTLSHEIATP